MKERRGTTETGQILNELVDYTRVHFTFEEEQQRNANYPDLGSHIELHEKLVDQVVEYQKKFHSGDKMLSMEILDLLKNWLINHILGNDKKYVPYMLKAGIK